MLQMTTKDIFRFQRRNKNQKEDKTRRVQCHSVYGGGLSKLAQNSNTAAKAI